MARPWPTDDAALAGRGEALSALAAGRRVEGPVVLVAAHPDDETVGAGGRLPLLEGLTIVHVTDGAPADPSDARRAGFAGAGQYRRAREAELGEALARLGLAPRLCALGLQDQTAVEHLAPLTAWLVDLLTGAEVVLTHAYEGGHPDHDACAFVVQTACGLIARRGGRPPRRLEFAGYHKRGGGRTTGAFWPDADHPSRPAPLSAEQLGRKRAALAAFRSQAEVIAWFDPADEAYREAPRYDFEWPPPPGQALYDDWGWPVTSASWRAAARAARLALEARATA